MNIIWIYKSREEVSETTGLFNVADRNITNLSGFKPKPKSFKLKIMQRFFDKERSSSGTIYKVSDSLLLCRWILDVIVGDVQENRVLDAVQEYLEDF